MSYPWRFLGVAYVVMLLGCGSGRLSTGSSLEKAVLAEDWSGVVPECSTMQPSAVVRCLLGHACLALNRNNQSLGFFLSVANDSDRQMWLSWTTDFARRHPRAAVARYLKGDALARLERWQEALTELNAALRCNRRHALSLNARGVVNHALGNTDAAREDFRAATEARPDFADAYSSWGTLAVLQNVGARTAAEHFAAALARSNDFDLATNGLGCAYWALQKFDSASLAFAAIPRHSPAGILARANMVAIEVGRLDSLQQIASSAGMALVSERYEPQRERAMTALAGSVHLGGVEKCDSDRVKKVIKDLERELGVVPTEIVHDKGDTIQYDLSTPDDTPPPQKYRARGTPKSVRARHRNVVSNVRPQGVETRLLAFMAREPSQWLVCNWYGLAYAVPPRPVSGGGQ